MSVPQYARITRRDLGNIPQWADQILDHVQEQLEFLTKDANISGYEPMRLRLRDDTWVRVKLRRIKSAMSAFGTSPVAYVTGIQLRSTSEDGKVDVKVKFNPVPTDAVDVGIVFVAG